MIWLVVLLLVLLAWAYRRSAETDQELARLRRDLDHLHSRVRELEDERPLVAPPVVPSPPPVPPAPHPGLPIVTAAEADPIGDPRSVTVADEEADVLERAIGERWLLYAGVVLLLLAVVFFLRYAFERNWLSPAVRVASGAVAGLMLTLGGRQLAAAGYRNYGLSLAGAGFAALYLSTYAALNFYGLVPAALAFVLLAIVSAAAAWLADAHASPPLAVVAVVGGFTTPFLVGGHHDAQLVLFTYDAVLIAATTVLAFRQEWWYLNVIGFVLTVATVGAWAAEYYTDAVALRTELFLTLYCTMFLLVLRASLRWPHAEARRGSLMLVAAPFLYHIVSIGILYGHAEAFPTYMILAPTVALLVAERGNLPLLRGITWLLVTVPLAEWLDVYRSHVPAAVVTIVAVYAVFLAAELQALTAKTWHPSVDAFVSNASGLVVFAELYIVLSGRVPDHLALIATVLGVWNGGLVALTRTWDASRALHWAGVAATLLAIAIAIAFDGPWIVVMWGVEGAALMAIAMRPDSMSTGEPHNIKSGVLSVGGWALMVIATLRWAAPDIQRVGDPTTPLLNARALSGLLLVALFYALALFEGAAADRDRDRRRQRAAMFVWANVLTVAVISREIDAYWAARAAAGDVTEIVRQAMLSASWAVYAAVAIAVGIRRRYRPVRYVAIALFAVTVGKVFVVDLDTLAGVDRILAFLVVGVVLLFASFLYQRGRTLNS